MVLFGLYNLGFLCLTEPMSLIIIKYMLFFFLTFMTSLVKQRVFPSQDETEACI